MSFLIEPALFLMLVVCAIAVVRMRDLFGAAMLFGLFSLCSCCLYVIMDAVDVAFTEAAVGAGISTVLILGTLALTSKQERQQRLRLLPFVVAILTGIALVYGVSDLPAYGDARAPIHQHVAPGFIAGTKAYFGIPNIVTAVLGSYRGFDTFGETTVIFTAAIGVLLLLYRVPRKLPTASNGSHMLMRDKVVVRVLSKAFVPFVLLYALYVQFHGDFGPGGGFQAGVIMAAGLILHGLIYGLRDAQRVVPPRAIEIGLALGVLLYGGVGVWSISVGGNFLEYAALDPAHPAHGQHLGLLLIEGGVGITVACAMTGIYYYVAGRGLRPEESA